MCEKGSMIANLIYEILIASGFLKDYIFPIAIAFFSSILGAYVAHYSFKRQEKIFNERRKLDAINKWILLADDAHQNLIAIKSNYHGILDGNPLGRSLSIPTILIMQEKIEGQYHELSFISKKLKNHLLHPEWSQIPVIRGIFKNYNQVQDVWIKRNEIERSIKNKIIESSTGGRANLTLEDIELLIGLNDIASLIELTEMAIMMTDSLVYKFYQFLDEFPTYSENYLNLKILDGYGSVLKYYGENNIKLQELLKYSPALDYEALSYFFSLTPDELKKKYRPLYR